MAISKYGKFIVLMVLLAGFAICATSALAAGDESTVGKDKFRIALGGFLPAIDSQLTITSRTINLGTRIDLEDDLGFDENVNIFRLDGYWRFAKRHRFYFGYYGFDRSTSKILTDQIQIADKLFDVGVGVFSDWKIDFYTATYSYSFIQSQKWEVSGSLGVYYLDTVITLRGEGYISDGQGGWGTAREITEKEDVGLPIPLFGLSAEYHLTPKWRIRGSGRYFTLSLDEWSGHILDAGVALEFLFHKNLGIGAGYTYFDVEIDRDKVYRFSELDYTYNGAQIYGILYF